MKNQVILIGTVCADPVLRNTTSGATLCNFKLMTYERWIDAKGTQQEHKEYHQMVAWGKLASYCSERLKSGDVVSADGKNATRKWTKDGIDHYTTEVIAREVVIISLAARRMSTNQQHDGPPAAIDPAMDDVPF